MSELASFGATGGARGVDQRGGVCRAQRRKPGGQLVGVLRRAGLGELVERLGARTVDVQHPAQGGKLGAELADHRRVRVGLDERQHGFRILQHPAHLLGGRRLVDRHRDPADGQDREVENGPLVAGGREDGHPVTGLHAHRDQAQCGSTNLLGRLSAGDVGPDAVDLALVDDEVGIIAFVLEDRSGDVVVLADGKAGRDAVLTHCADLVRSSLTCGPGPAFCRPA